MLNLDKTLSFYENALTGLSLSQRVTTHNIANQNTPGYRAKAVGFERALSKALESGDASSVRYEVREAIGMASKSNGNNVDIEHEIMNLEQHRLMHEVIARATGGTFRGLLSAIRSR